jgi:hypothetical protein
MIDATNKNMIVIGFRVATFHFLVDKHVPVIEEANNDVHYDDNSDI